MGTLENLAQEPSMSTSTGNSYAGPGKADQFPAGLRVLAVDDDRTCLKILEQMLRKCLYQVTTCCRARVALSMLRGRKGGFDLVISDVYMPDMDGFKLLEHVGLEMDLPVIMMSADGGTSTVMKGVKHGACDYLIKPVRLEELKNIWQHVIRKKRNASKDFDHSGSVEENERHRKGSDDVEYASSVNEGTDGNWKHPRKRKEAKEDEDDGKQDNDDPSASKKPRVVWSVELHQQFVNAVNKLGIDKAVPKRILELMNVEGLTRENVASHLQKYGDKYRLYLKRLSGVAQQQSGMTTSFVGSLEANVGSVGSLARLDLQALAPPGHVSPQALVALQAEILGRVNATNGLGIPGVDQALLLQAALRGANCNPMNRVRLPLMNGQGSLLQGLPVGLEMKQFAQPQQRFPSLSNVGSSIDDTSGFSMLQQQLSTNGVLGSVDQMSGMNNNGSLNPQNNAMMVQLIHQQQQQVNEQQQQMQTSATQQHQPSGQLHGAQLQSEVLSLTSTSLIGPQSPSNDIRGRTNLLPPMGNSNANLGNSIIGASSSGQLNHIPMPAYNLIVSESNASVGMGRIPAVDYTNQNAPILQGGNYAIPNTICASAPLTSIGTEGVLNIPGLQRLGRMSDIVSSPMLSGSGINFGASTGLGQSLSQNGRQGWQAQNLSMNQDLSQTASAVPSLCHMQSSFGTQGLNTLCVQDQGQLRSFGIVGKGLGLPSRLSLDTGCLKTVSNDENQKEPFIADSGLRLKTECISDLVANPKTESGLLSEQFSSDDLMHFILKQQQEGMVLTEGEFGLDGYQLDNIHVK